MPDNEARLLKERPRTPWNKGKLIGQAPTSAKARLVDQNTFDG
jgi:hypothetical protein